MSGRPPVLRPGDWVHYDGREHQVVALAGTSVRLRAWRALVSTLEAMLRLHKHDPGTPVALDEYLYRRTSGMIGSLSQLVRGAAILAIEDGTEQITKELLDTVPVDYAAATPPRQRRTPRGKAQASA